MSKRDNQAEPRSEHENRLQEEMDTAFGDSDPHELIATDSARLAHLRMVVRGTLKTLSEERWQLALEYLADGFEREEHARRRQAGEELEPFWLTKMRRSSGEYHAELNRSTDGGDD